MKNEKLTSVKVDKDLFQNFKEKAFMDKVTFHRLVEFAMKRYISDEDFRKTVRS